jgi:hypothetical protein
MERPNMKIPQMSTVVLVAALVVMLGLLLTGLAVVGETWSSYVLGTALGMAVLMFVLLDYHRDESPPAGTEEPPAAPARSRWLALFALGSGAFVVALNATAVAVVLPTVAWGSTTTFRGSGVDRRPLRRRRARRVAGGGEARRSIRP